MQLSEFDFPFDPSMIAAYPCLPRDQARLLVLRPRERELIRLSQTAEIFLIMGLDAFLEIDTWKAFRELLSLVSVIVISPPDADGLISDRGAKTLEDFIRSRISADLTVSGSPVGFSSPGIRGVRLFPMTALDISSSRIRDLVRTGRSIRFLVPAAVRECIQTKGLYS